MMAYVKIEAGREAKNVSNCIPLRKNALILQLHNERVVSITI